MSKFIVKNTNRTALVLSNFHSTLEASLQGLNRIEYNRHLIIKNDPISTQHVIVQNKDHTGASLRIEKSDVELANHNRQELYHLLSKVLDTVKPV